MKNAALLLTLLAPSAMAAPAPCKIKLSGVAYTHPTLGSALVLNPEAKRAFESLGFKREKQVDGLKFGNHCPSLPLGEGTAYGKSGVPFLLNARNACEKAFAESLGLTPQVIENFGSMDSGGELPAASLLACSDGKQTVACSSYGVKADASLVDSCPAHFQEAKAAR